MSAVAGTPRRASATGPLWRLWAFILRHPVLTVAILAFVVRMAVAIALNIVGSGDLVQDDRVYLDIVRRKVDGTLGSLDPYYSELYSTTWAFTEPLTFLGRVFGVHVLVGQVLIALWGALTAAATTAIARRTITSRRLALLAGLVPALLPSQILWSSVWLKDAAVSACLAAVVLGLTMVTRATTPTQRRVGVMMGTAGLVGLSGLRLNSFVLACWCLAIVVIAFSWRKPAVVALTLALLVVGPWVGNAGILGNKVLATGENLGAKRAAGASNAESALVEPPALGGGRNANGLGANLRYLPEGIVALLVRPVPWEGSTSRASLFAKADNLIWYPIFVLGLLGLWTARKRKEYVLVILLVCGTVGVYALAEGNLGTAFRHRGEVVWATALLMCFYLDARRRRRPASASPVEPPIEGIGRIRHPPSAQEDLRNG